MPSRRLVLLAVAALLCSLQCSHAYWLPFGTSTTRLTPELARAACRGQGTRSVCWPTNLPDQYLDCDQQGMGQPRRCPRGTLYDYVRRTCVDSDQARPCPWWPVPRPFNVGLPSANNTGGPALGAPYGTFGRPGNETIHLPIAGTFLVFCPVMGHGPLGQNVEVVVTCPGPRDRTPYTHVVDLETITTNADVYPRRVASVRAFCGDRLHVRWQANFHLAQVFNISPYARRVNSDQLVMSRPPQPVYQCPTWRYEPAPPPAPAGSIRLVPNPGDEVLVAPTRAPGNFTYQPETIGEFFIADASAAYCRLGMVFKLTVRPYPPFYAPVTYNISWSIDMDNYPDLTIFLGDRVHFHWTSPNQNVAILRVANLTMISPDPQPATCRPPTRGLKDLVRGFYGIIAMGDFSGLLLNLADDFTVESNFRAPEVGFTGRYDRSTMIDFLILLTQRFNLTSFELVRFIEEGDTVITYQHWVGAGADYGRGLDTTVVQRWVFRDDNRAYMLREFTEAANMASILYPNNTCTPQGKVVIDCNYVPGPIPSPRPFGPGGKRL